jgi:hypothetical protein
MVCSCCDFRDASNRQFNAEKAAKELQAYQKGRLGPTTRLMRDGVVDLGLNRGSLLDIGGGVGALTFELLDRGTTKAVIADASAAYAAAARDEALRRARTESATVECHSHSLLDSRLAPDSLGFLFRRARRLQDVRQTVISFVTGVLSHSEMSLGRRLACRLTICSGKHSKK